MNLISKQLSSHFKQVYEGGNWSCSNIQQQLSDVNWEQAILKKQDLNSIAQLAYHMHYYTEAAIHVLEGKKLEAKDELSFNHPPILHLKEWEKLKEQLNNGGKRIVQLLEDMPDERLWQDFTDPKYGSYFRNLMGIIEHIHYHLGQLVLIKKLIQNQVI